MNKLYSLRDYLTISESAEHLSIALGENIKEADILRLALDYKLKLSVNFIKGVHARCGKLVDFEKSKYSQSQGTPSNKQSDDIKANKMGLFKNQNSDVENDIKIVVDKEISEIKGVWDILVTDGGRLYIESLYQRYIKGPFINLTKYEETFVERADGSICELCETFNNCSDHPGSIAELNSIKSLIAGGDISDQWAQDLLDKHRQAREDNYETILSKDSSSCYPKTLASDSILVVRIDALRDFEKTYIRSMNDENHTIADSATKTNNRNKELQQSANALAHHWLVDLKKKKVTKREIAEALAASEEWNEYIATTIERIIIKEW